MLIFKRDASKIVSNMLYATTFYRDLHNTCNLRFLTCVKCKCKVLYRLFLTLFISKSITWNFPTKLVEQSETLAGYNQTVPSRAYMSPASSRLLHPSESVQFTQSLDLESVVFDIRHIDPMIKTDLKYVSKGMAFL